MPNLYHAAAGMNHLDLLAENDSPVHRLHPMVKLVSTLVYIVVVISFPATNVSGLVPFLLYPVILMAVSETPYRPLLGRMTVALPFSLFAGISNIIFLREPMFYMGGFVITFGLVSCVSILLKTLLTVMAVLILISTTSFISINEQLIKLRVPKIFCLQLIMTYRYISVLLGEAVAMYTAYLLRAGGHKAIAMKDMGSFLGQLLLRSFDRAGRVYEAMKCRGFSGVYKCGKQSKPDLRDLLYLGLMIIMIIALRFFNLSVFLGNLAG